jgi:hypothetical protein
VQFASWACTQRAKDSGLLPSMGSVGDCYDNAMMEAFWSRLQVELLDRRRWHIRVELANAIFEYLEIFHNRQHPRHRRGEFLDFPELVAHAHPRRQRHVVLDITGAVKWDDAFCVWPGQAPERPHSLAVPVVTTPPTRNYATHKHAKVQAWLARHPRIHLHVTPTDGSWLNLVEVFSAIIERQALCRGDFASVEELVAAIRRFCDGWNQRCRPFTWTTTPSRFSPSSSVNTSATDH